MKEEIIINNYRTFFYIICFSLLFIGCKKDSASSDRKEQGSLVFKIEGIQPVQDDLGKQSKVASSTRGSEGVSTEYQKIGNVDVSVQANVANMATSFGGQALNLRDNNSKKMNKLVANVGMAVDIKYVVLLFNTTTRRTEFIGQASVGQSLVIDAVKGQQYDWIAYSYNKTDIITNLPTSIDDVIDTPTDGELLYANGTISTTEENSPISILFKHKLAQIVFEIDTDRLFGKINTDVVLSFVDGSPLTKGKMSLKNGGIDSIVSYAKPVVLEEDPNDENIRLARFNVVDVGAQPSFSVNVSNLKVTYLNNVEHDLVAANDVRRVDFTWPSNISLGKRYIGTLKLWYKFPKRTILHVTRVGADGYGYAAQPYYDGVKYYPEYNKASYNLMAEPRNYGSLPESIVRSGGFSHLRCYRDGQLNYFLEGRYKPAPNPTTTPDVADKDLPLDLTKRPDIVIISVYYLMDEDDRTALITYINAGGVVLLMTDGVNSADRVAQQPFFRDLFNNQSITLQNNGYLGGALYKLSDIDDEILNGPFGDIRGKYWGEDASATTSLANVPSSEITEYSEAKAANGTVAANGITMFKHKTKHFFWIGDGGFLSNERVRGIYENYTLEPFATVDLTQAVSFNPVARYNYNNFPVPKKYGYAGNGISAGNTDVYNSTIFANIMSWAVINAEFFGINTSGFGKLLPVTTDWDSKTDSLNVNF
ncbi:fimbrillin family protein [Sphingobacterium rhinopitheci]|uniref:fimbrillin family protein n=1 Tax=Sphingobacterium rhinopitheci TaxID=2781960 RepID=UPI001F5224AB|nr:fimbrillin family protein [Sphingobacterium rhinopitheci]MCI0921727.1 fimbrillin family protein [Sphingobacterium rhinopitheci]